MAGFEITVNFSTDLDTAKMCLSIANMYAKQNGMGIFMNAETDSYELHVRPAESTWVKDN